MKKLESVLKRKISSYASKVAEKTVGKSMPIVVHEPKVPSFLKNKEFKVK